MSIVHIPMIEGDKKPIVGQRLLYELKIDTYFSVRWQILNRNGTALSDKDKELYDK